MSLFLKANILSHIPPFTQWYYGTNRSAMIDQDMMDFREICKMKKLFCLPYKAQCYEYSVETMIWDFFPFSFEAEDQLAAELQISLLICFFNTVLYITLYFLAFEKKTI